MKARTTFASQFLRQIIRYNITALVGPIKIKFPCYHVYQYTMTKGGAFSIQTHNEHRTTQITLMSGSLIAAFSVPRRLQLPCARRLASHSKAISSQLCKENIRSFKSTWTACMLHLMFQSTNHILDTTMNAFLFLNEMAHSR